MITASAWEANTPARLRSVTIRRGSSGAALRFSTTTKSVSSTTQAAKRDSVAVQPSVSARVKP